jgi:hypothetical protein
VSLADQWLADESESPGIAGWGRIGGKAAGGKGEVGGKGFAREFDGCGCAAISFQKQFQWNNPVKQPTYPFKPKSTAHLLPGQFWPIALKSGRFACGRVLQVSDQKGNRDQRMFFGGLMDWSGSTPPTSDSLADKPVLRVGRMHIKTITHFGAEIVGCRSLDEDGLVLPMMLDRSPLDQSCKVVRGPDVVGLASLEQRSTLKTMSAWGFSVVNNLAETTFGGHFGHAHP